MTKRARQLEFVKNIVASWPQRFEKEGVYQKEIAHHAKISETALSLILNGKSFPTLGTIDKVEGVLKQLENQA